MSVQTIKRLSFGKKRKVIKSKIARFLQKLVKKYIVTKSGSNRELAKRLLSLRSHIMYKKDLKKVEDFLKLPKSKRYHGKRKIIKGSINLFGKKRISGTPLSSKMKKRHARNLKLRKRRKLWVHKANMRDLKDALKATRKRYRGRSKKELAKALARTHKKVRKELGMDFGTKLK
jgi:hypothetical protein